MSHHTDAAKRTRDRARPNASARETPAPGPRPTRRKARRRRSLDDGPDAGRVDVLLGAVAAVAPDLHVPANQRVQLAAFVETAFLRRFPHETVLDAIVFGAEWSRRWFGNSPAGRKFAADVCEHLLDEQCDGEYTRPRNGRAGIAKAWRQTHELRVAIVRTCLDMRPPLFEVLAGRPPKPVPHVRVRARSTSLPELPSDVPVNVDECRRSLDALREHLRANVDGEPERAPELLRERVAELFERVQQRHRLDPREDADKAPVREQFLEAIARRMIELDRVIRRATDPRNPKPGTVAVAYAQRPTGRHFAAADDLAAPFAVNVQTMSRFVRAIVFAGCHVIDIDSAQPTIALALATRGRIGCAALRRLVRDKRGQRARLDAVIAGTADAPPGLAKGALTAALFDVAVPSAEQAFAIEGAARAEGRRPGAALVRDLGALGCARLHGDPWFRRFAAERDAIFDHMIETAERVSTPDGEHYRNAAGMLRPVPRTKRARTKRDRRETIAFLLQGHEAELLRELIATVRGVLGAGRVLVALHDGVIVSPMTREEARSVEDWTGINLSNALGFEVSISREKLAP